MPSPCDEPNFVAAALGFCPPPPDPKIPWSFIAIMLFLTLSLLFAIFQPIVEYFYPKL